VSSGLLIFSNLLFLVLDFVFPVLLFVVRRKERGQARPAAGAGLCAGSSSRRLARERGVLQARALGAQGSQASRGQGDARAQHLLALVAGHVGGAAVSPEHSRLDPGGARAVPAGSAAGVSKVGHSSGELFLTMMYSSRVGLYHFSG